MKDVESQDLADGIADGGGFDFAKRGPSLEEGVEVVVRISVPVNRGKSIPEPNVDSG